MKYNEANATIKASPATVWSVLVDGSNYTAWDSGVVRLDGQIAQSEKIKVVSSANPKRAFPVTVTGFSPETSMEWSGGMPLGLFRGVRTFTLTPTTDGGTHFTVREEYTGPLLGLIWRSMPDLGPSFEQFAQGLKNESETRS